MRKLPAVIKAKKNQGGYAILIVLFLTTLVLIAAMSIGLRVATQGRRQKEQEMIWRGNQYVRGIKLYYRKFGRFPTSMDQLIKPSVGNNRFMRQAYKDPMNKEDGSWRLIYVGPAGQLIGSLKPQTGGIQMPVAGGPPPPQVGFGTQPGAPGGQLGFATPPGAGAPAPGAATTGSAAGAQGTDTGVAGTDSQTVPTGDTPTIMGGNIIGVGSKVNQPSVMVYEKAKNYRMFEFIWDPSKDMGIVASPGAPLAAPAGTPGQNPTGSPFNPLNPPAGPPTAVPNPQQP